MPGDILLLSPSTGMGGGIERYVSTIQDALTSEEVTCVRLDLQGPGVTNHVRIVGQAKEQLRRMGAARLVIAHRGLMPAATVIARDRRAHGISVLCHGSDVWGARYGVRWLGEQMLMRSSDVRIVAVSSFTAGALFGSGATTILRPGVSQQWYELLLKTKGMATTGGPGISIVTVFRLADWRDKGLPELLKAVDSLGRSDVHVKVCGSGKPPPDLIRATSGRTNCTISVSLSDNELAWELAAADLFVLATRTRRGRRPSGEGFGMVLMEAQLAGTAVVGPAYGGSHDAYIEGVTGLTPTDESSSTLAVLLEKVIGDSGYLARMGLRAAEWSAEAFAPASYAPLAIARLL